VPKSPDSNRPKLSIAITTYNRRLLLEQCLASVVETQVDCEIAIFDDASTDGTAEFVQNFVTKDPRIKHFRQETNVGMTANLRTALSHTSGEYICQLSDDDSVVPGNYEKKAAILDRYPEVDFVYSLAYMTDDSNQRRQLIWRPGHMNYSYIGGRHEFYDLITGNYIPGISVMFRRTLFEQLGGYDENLAPTLTDWDLWLRYCYRGQTAYIHEPLVNVRMHSGGASHENLAELATGMIPVWRKWLVEREDPPVLDPRTWERMRAFFTSEVQRCLPDDAAGQQACMAEFERLRQDAATNASRRLASLSTALPPS
jgi:glycosyltransferase involved in cell wall biosynthesis